MGFAVSGAGITPNQEVNQQNSIDLGNEIALTNKELKEAISEANQTIDTEIGAASKEQLTGKANDTASFLNPSLLQKAEKKPPQLPTNQEFIGQDGATKEAAMIAALEQEKEVEKKEQKQSKLNEKLDKMAKLEGLIDVSHADNEEDQNAITKLFDNLGRIRNLKQELKRLEYDEEHALALLKEKKRQEEEARRKKLKDYKDEQDAKRQNKHPNSQHQDPEQNQDQEPSKDSPTKSEDRPIPTPINLPSSQVSRLKL